VVHERVLAQPKEPSEFGSLTSEPQPLLWLTDQREYRIARPLTARKGARPRIKYTNTYNKSIGMDVIAFRSYCLAKKGVTEEFPFDEHTLVFKVMGKIFALTGLDSTPFTANLKADPEYAIELREAHPDVQPGYHMNKKHWNTVNCEGILKDSLIKELIDHSYDQVVKGLPKKTQTELAQL
jgi:predicted DNA-binding protein (MmcQ/YjbR family)